MKTRLGNATSGVLTREYNELNDVQKNFVTNADKLTQDSKIDNVREINFTKAKGVQAVIDHMQVLSESDKYEAIEAIEARAAYDSLTGVQKAIVTNYNLLKDAENKIARLGRKIATSYTTNQYRLCRDPLLPLRCTRRVA